MRPWKSGRYSYQRYLHCQHKDPEILRELLRETVEPAQAFCLAINMELRQRNQLQILNNQPALQVNSITPQRPFRQRNHRQNFAACNRQTNQLCRNCGPTWSANQKDKSIAKGNICGLQNHFSRVFRKPKSASSKSARPNVNSIEEDTTEKSVSSFPNTNYIREYGSDYDSSDDVVASIASTTVQIERKKHELTDRK